MGSQQEVTRMRFRVHYEFEAESDDEARSIALANNFAGKIVRLEREYISFYAVRLGQPEDEDKLEVVS